MKWLTYSRGQIPLYRAAIFLLGVQKYCRRFEGQRVRTLYFNSEKKLLWSWQEAEIRKVGFAYLKKVATKNGLKREIAKRYKYMDNSNKEALRIAQKDITSLSDRELAREFRLLQKAAMLGQGVSGVNVDAFDIVFEEFFYKKLSKFFQGKLKPGDIGGLFAKLATPVYKSYIAVQDQDILKSAKSKDLEKQAARLHKKYWWTDLGWENVIPHKVSYFKRRLQRARKTRHLKHSILAIDNQLRKIRRQRKSLAVKHKLPREILHYLYVLDEYARFHDKRKEMQVKSIYALRKILNEIARRKKYNSNDLQYFWPDEIIGILDDQFRKINEIKQRRQAVIVIAGGKQLKLWTGREAMGIYNREYQAETEAGFKALKGLGVSGGRVIGRVQVCQGISEAKAKMKKGDILVCHMTLPDYVPVMKLAKAIITNEGGLTSHAAIISRELGTPCVIGTKNATQVLKSGDRVEVDADRGIIKKYEAKRNI